MEKLRKAYRTSSEIHRKKGHDYINRLQIATSDYLKICREISAKVLITIQDYKEHNELKINVLLIELKRYHDLLVLFVSQVERRIIFGEQIPHEEKLFSIFEPHTEWLSKGKLHRPVELGRNVCVVSDQHQFILFHEVLQKTVDKHTTIGIGKKVVELYKKEHYKHKSISFDRNYYSYAAKIKLTALFEFVVLPKPGKKTEQVNQLENSTRFVQLRNAHSAVESNINHLEQTGLDKCPDKKEKGFKRYVALGVLAYNLQRLGKLLRAA